MRKQVKGNVSWVGYIDWELESFHGDDYSIMNGSSQNAYLIEEEKTVLIDTVWTPHRFDFVENLKKEIDLKKIDFIVANHGECDHSGALSALLAEIPGTPVYCTANAVKSLEGQYGKLDWNFHVVKTGDSVDIGNGKKLVFVEMRMLHWPDSMATYMTGDNAIQQFRHFRHCETTRNTSLRAYEVCVVTWQSNNTDIYVIARPQVIRHCEAKPWQRGNLFPYTL